MVNQLHCDILTIITCFSHPTEWSWLTMLEQSSADSWHIAPTKIPKAAGPKNVISHHCNWEYSSTNMVDLWLIYG